MKMYTKIKRPDNTSRRDKHIQVGELISIQEKIDGSNVSIWNDNGNLRLFSRNGELTEDDFCGFKTYVEERKEKLLATIPVGVVLYGEWLGQGKIPYNTKAKQGKMERLYIFDSAKDITFKLEEDTENEESIDRTWLSVKESQELANKCGLAFVPILDEIVFEDYESIKEKYVDNQKSMIDEESYREGIVIKSIDGYKRIKIVGEKFSEIKRAKIKKNSDDFLTQFITPARIQKFIMKIKEQGTDFDEYDVKNYGLVFKNTQLLADDIIEEEIDLIKVDLIRKIRTVSVDFIKDYLSRISKE